MCLLSFNYSSFNNNDANKEGEPWKVFLLVFCGRPVVCVQVAKSEINLYNKGTRVKKMRKNYIKKKR